MTEEMVGWHHQFNNPTQPYPATLSGHSHSIGHPWAAESLQTVTTAMKLKRCLLFGRKAMTNLGSVLKSRDITLPTEVHLAKAMVFPVVMYGCESWTVKKADCRRIDAFELWCWTRLLRVPGTARLSNQSVLKSTLTIHWKV